MKTKHNIQCFMRRVCLGSGHTRMVDVGLQIVQYVLLKEVGFVLQRDHIHEVEGVGDIVYPVIAKRDKQVISNKFNALAH